MAASQPYREGDWIVHFHFGIGEIKGIDKREISGQETRYYRIETVDSTFWMPVAQMDSELLRPLSTPEEIEEAIASLKRTPRAMSANYKSRSNRIQQVQERNTPLAFARLIRDLRERQRQKGNLNSTERSAFRSCKKQLINEWAVVMGVQPQRVAQKLDQLLNPGKAAPEEQQLAMSTPGGTTATAGDPSPAGTWLNWPGRSKK